MYNITQSKTHKDIGSNVLGVYVAWSEADGSQKSRYRSGVVHLSKMDNITCNITREGVQCCEKQC